VAPPREEFADAERTAITKTGQLVGTIAYLPPEQFNKAPPSAMGDLYSLGLVLYEALTGELPLTTDDIVAACRGQLEQFDLFSSAAAQSIPEQLKPILARAMAIDPSQRYESAAVFRDTLNGWLEGNETTLEPEQKELPRQRAVDETQLLAKIVKKSQKAAVGGIEARTAPSKTKTVVKRSQRAPFIVLVSCLLFAGILLLSYSAPTEEYAEYIAPERYQSNRVSRLVTEYSARLDQQLITPQNLLEDSHLTAPSNDLSSLELHNLVIERLEACSGQIEEAALHGKSFEALDEKAFALFKLHLVLPSLPSTPQGNLMQMDAFYATRQLLELEVVGGREDPRIFERFNKFLLRTTTERMVAHGGGFLQTPSHRLLMAGTMRRNAFSSSAQELLEGLGPQLHAAFPEDHPLQWPLRSAWLRARAVLYRRANDDNALGSLLDELERLRLRLPKSGPIDQAHGDQLEAFVHCALGLIENASDDANRGMLAAEDLARRYGDDERVIANLHRPLLRGLLAITKEQFSTNASMRTVINRLETHMPDDG